MSPYPIASLLEPSIVQLTYFSFIRTGVQLASTAAERVAFEMSREELMKLSFSEPGLPKTGTVIVCVGDGSKLSASARQLDKATGGRVARHQGKSVHG